MICIQVRGTSGSGKSTVMRSIMKKLGEWQPIFTDGRKKPLAYSYIHKPKLLVEKVISGGQTGADRAGLEVAKELGYKTGGAMPLGFEALDGPHPEFKDKYEMHEIATS